MESSQDEHGGLFKCIHIKGTRSLYVLDPTPLNMSKASNLTYYTGSVQSGGQGNKMNACDAIIVRFNTDSGAGKRYDLLVSLDHPCILKALGHGRGIGDHRRQSFLALSLFETTFEAYAEKNGPGVDPFGRFTEEFIGMISNIIDGLEELHRLDYCCPSLDGKRILVVRQHDSLSAKLWAFKSCTSDQEKDQDWLRLGLIIFNAAKFGDEAKDLYKRIQSGDLKGKSILKHNALLTVRKKFKNILSLYLHVELNHPQKKPDQSLNEEQSQNQPSQITQNKDYWINVSDICAANLQAILDKQLTWDIPTWMGSSTPKTLRGFIKQMRIIFQHEVSYIPKEMLRKLTAKELGEGKHVMDLDHQLQDSCGGVFRAVQRLVADLKLNS